jgi:hypothetical protein
MKNQSTFSRREVERSFRKFRDIVNDLFSAKFQQWDDMFTHLIAHCENDPVMTVITEPLKNDPRVNATKWWDDAIASVRGMVGSGHYALPTDDDERTALLYQVFLGIENNDWDLSRFNMSVFGHTHYQDMVDTFNQELVLKFTREMSYRLDEVVADNEDADEIPREAMIVFHHHDQSTTVHGNFQGIAGNVTNSSITQEQSMTITQSDFQSLRSYLVAAGLTDHDIDGLEAAIRLDPTPDSPEQIGEKVSSWIGKMVTKAASGAWQISTNAAGGLLTNAVWAFYGFG